jgi:serine/threonine-protein kinase
MAFFRGRPMSARPRFCYGCNEKVEPDATGGVCPVCGQELQSLPTESTDDFLLATARYGIDASGPETPTEIEDDLVGRMVGDYDVEAFAGRGGMARVYRARHRHLERLCALKVLDERALRSDPASVERFFAEARSAAGLVHPHVVTVHNLCASPPYHFIEMEYVDGRSLGRELGRRRRFGAHEATRLLAEVCSGLGAAHASGLVHRDVKPSNVLLASTGTAKLADFGLAKRVLSREGPSRWDVAGTPHFMAPELFEGLPATTRSDVYAAGVTYFLLLTGRTPFSATSLHELVALHREAEPPRVDELFPETPAAAADILAACLAKRPARRLEDAAVLERELRSLLGRLRSLDELVRLAVEPLGLAWHARRDGVIEVVVGLDGGRRQRVLVEEGATVGGGEPLIRVSSPSAPVAESYLRQALELNAEIHHAAIAIEEVDGDPYFVVRAAYPRATCDPEEIRDSVLTVAAGADAVEDVLTGRDRH